MTRHLSVMAVTLSVMIAHAGFGADVVLAQYPPYAPYVPYDPGQNGPAAAYGYGYAPSQQPVSPEGRYVATADRYEQQPVYQYEYPQQQVQVPAEPTQLDPYDEAQAADQSREFAMALEGESRMTASEGEDANKSAVPPSTPYPTTDGQTIAYDGNSATTSSDNCDCDTAQPGEDCGYGGYAYPDCDQCDRSFYGSDGGTGRIWFGGVYGLLMERDDATAKVLAVDPSPAGYPYFPQPGDYVLSTTDAGYDWQGGAEIRFGSTLGNANHACDGCEGSYYGANCGAGCGGNHLYAWEIGYWALDDGSETAIRQADTRIYSMVNFSGIEHDPDGGGFNPVNTYYDYQMPIQAPAGGDIVVNAFLVRTSFSAQNLELNFLRIPVYGCFPCGGSSCAPQPGLTVTGICGIRYLRFDDDFLFAAEYNDPASPTPYDGFFNSDNELFYEINVDNNLVGCQLGCDMSYWINCRWSLFCDSMFGLYGNRIGSHQRVYAWDGDLVRYTESQEAVNEHSSKTDVSFLGELRMGAAYQVTCHCRLTLAWRALAASGIALSVDQIPDSMPNSHELQQIESNSSLILHGLQAGVEYQY